MFGDSKETEENFTKSRETLLLSQTRSKERLYDSVRYQIIMEANTDNEGDELWACVINSRFAQLRKKSEEFASQRKIS